MIKKLLLALVCATMMSTFFLSYSYAKTAKTSSSTLAILDDQAASKKNSTTKNNTSTNKGPLNTVTNALKDAIQTVTNNTRNAVDAVSYCNNRYQNSADITACINCSSKIDENTGRLNSCMAAYKRNHPEGTNPDTNQGSGGNGNGGSDSSGQVSGNSSSNITDSNGANTGTPDEKAENHYADITQPDIVFEGRTGETFLGLVSWDSGVNISDQKSLISGIWTIAANVLVDITVIASYLVLAYVIYGGYLYTFSTGEAGKVELGKKTLTRAFIGLAIVLLANIIMNSIRFALLGASGKLTDCATSECINPTTAIASAINWVIGIAGVVSVVFVIYGGIMYITSAGDAGKVEKAKKTIIYSLIGLVIVALSVIISSFVSSTIMNSKKSSFINNYQETISKEVNEIETL